MASNTCVIHVVGKDRSGIVYATSKILADCQANILDIRQSIVSGLFTMIMVVDIEHASITLDELQTQFKQLGSELKLEISVYREDIFDFMYRV